MKNKNIEISDRLTAICKMVSVGNRVVDVGCDHGFVPIYLVKNGICPHVLAMDVRRGPLSRAEEHIREYGLEPYIDTRLSDGLKEYKRGEADTLICAGMGGRLMMRILLDSGEKTGDFSEMILQPQSEIFEFRNELRRHGMYIADEKIIYEAGKYYFAMKAILSDSADSVCVYERGDEEIAAGVTLSEIYDRYGECLINAKDTVLLEYLQTSLRTQLEIEGRLSHSTGRKAEDRIKKLQHEKVCIKAAINLLK